MRCTMWLAIVSMCAMGCTTSHQVEQEAVSIERLEKLESLGDEDAHQALIREKMRRGPRTIEIEGDEYPVNVVFLDLSQKEVDNDSLEPLKHCLLLEKLGIDSRYLEDLSTLQYLTNLKELYLFVNAVTDVSPLSSLTNLTYLDLAGDSIEDVSALSSLTNLTTLSLRYTEVEDVSALSSLTNLTTLNLSNTNVSDVSALSSLTQLTYLDLESTDVSQIGALFAEQSRTAQA